MLRPFAIVLCLVLLAGCDSGEAETTDLFSVAVETPSGEPVPGLDLTMEYALGGTNDEGDRAAHPAVLRYFEVFELGDDRFSVEWETEGEEGLAQFVI